MGNITPPTHPPAAPKHRAHGPHVIEVRVAELWQLFDAIDPSPFNQRDLDPRADEFIVSWSRDLPRDEPLSLVVYLERAPGLRNEGDLLRDAIHGYYAQRVATSRRRVRELFRRGRISLAIGLTFLAGSIALGDLISTYFQDNKLAEIVSTSLIIGGWVAMWRPLEIFLYDWWPIRADARLYDQLGTMPVEIVYQADGEAKSFKPDWPAHEEDAAAYRRARRGPDTSFDQEQGGAM